MHHACWFYACAAALAPCLCLVHSHFNPFLPYRYHRIEVLGALASVLATWLVTGVLVWEAVGRMINPSPVNGKGASQCNPSKAAACPKISSSEDPDIL